MLSRKFYIHAFCWILFMAYEVTITIYLGNEAPLWQFAGFYVLNIGLFYFNAHVVFKRAFNDENRFLPLNLIICIILELSVYLIISLSMGYYFSKIQGNESLAFATEIDIVKSVWRGIYFLGISIAYWFFLQTIKATKRAHQLKVKQLETEAGKAKLEIEMIKLQNAYLKAQIDPHFLFNTLSFIYNLIEDNSPKAARSIELLSDVMRYSLSEIGRDGKVELTKEIAQIKKYIELNQLRFNQKLHLIVNIKSYQSYENLRIPPLVLLSFVENIFQHGDLTKHTHPGILALNFEDGTVHLHTENKRKNAISINSHHIGLQNVKSRLENFYKNSGYNLSINDKESKFIVDLKIKL